MEALERVFCDALLTEIASFAMTPCEAAGSGNIKVLEMLERADHHCADDVDLIVEAGARGHPHVIRWLLNLKRPFGKDCTQLRAATCAATFGYLDIIKDLHVDYDDNYREQCWDIVELRDAIVAADELDIAVARYAAEHGQLAVIEWAYDNCHIEWNETDVGDLAAENGHLHILEWLDKHDAISFTTTAMRDAIDNDDFEVVEWLHDNSKKMRRGWRRSDSIEKELTNAAEYGSFDIIELLHEAHSDDITENVLYGAAKNGHLKIVQLLHTYFDEYILDEAADLALQAGHLEIVYWLSGNTFLYL